MHGNSGSIRYLGPWRVRRQGWPLLPVMLLAGGLVALGALRTPPASAQQAGDAALRELAEQLLLRASSTYPGAPARVQTVELLPGQQPSGLPVTLPVPPGGRLVGSAVYRADGEMTGAEIVVQAPGTLDAVLAFYEQALGALEWRTLAAPALASGFQAPPSTRTSTFCPPTESGNAVTLTAFQGTERTIVRASFAFPPVVDFPGGPCNAPAPPVARTPQAPLLPQLTPPPDVQLVTLPIPPIVFPTPLSPPGPAVRSSQSAANATTRLGPAELEAYFAQQLEGAGWQRQAGRAEGALAWSIWQVPMGEGGQGFLLVLATSQDQRFLYLRVDTAGQDGPAGVPGTLFITRRAGWACGIPALSRRCEAAGSYRLERESP
jgi:hypothetical protein